MIPPSRAETEVSEATESLCPVCLRRVPAERCRAGDSVTLVGRCPEHGVWRTPLWRGRPSYESWCAQASGCGCTVGARPKEADTVNCPLSCGLCPEHRQSTCTAVLEVTRRCDLVCPVCFAEAGMDGTEPDPPVCHLERALRDLFVMQGPVNVQLSGGEPTMRPDLQEIIAASRAVGFEFVQLNTNGLRLAREPGYAESLAAAGLVSVFLQFDALSDAPYEAIRGRPLLAEKLHAVERCAEAGLAVVLVATVVPGVNDHELGALVRYGAEWAGAVKGVHIQPISYFGRYPGGARSRLTLPEVLRALETQTGGQVRADDFGPSSCEHARCSFHARYWVRENGGLELFRPASVGESAEPIPAARRAVAATARQWGRRESTASRNAGVAPPGGSVPPSGTRPSGGALQGGSTPPGAGMDALDRFLADSERILAVTGMLFQDAWNIDLERVRQCCVHAVVPGRGLVPFCLWNLTSESGQRLYPRGMESAP